MPVKEFATLRIIKNKTEKVAEYQIEITNFIGEDLKQSDLTVASTNYKPAHIVVRGFKFKCLLQRQQSPRQIGKVNPDLRKISKGEDDSELPTMDMLKHTSSNDRKDLDSGRIKTQLDESLVEAIMKKDELSAKDLAKPDLKPKGLVVEKL